MSHNSPDQIILKPIVTEKALRDRDNAKYHFWVSTSANKNQIKLAFQDIFSTTVIKVTTSILKGKTKTDWKKSLSIRRPNRKKAIISIPKDKSIKSLAVK